MNTISRISIILFFLGVHLFSFAGSQEGPYIVWINLSNNKEIDVKIKNQINKDIRRDANGNYCMPINSITFINIRPNGITNEIVHKAVVEGDKSAIKKVNKLMRIRYDDVINEGFDGVIVYDEYNGPRLSRLIAGKSNIDKIKLSEINSSTSLWDAFCKLVPPIQDPSEICVEKRAREWNSLCVVARGGACRQI